ncbi:hypothetical protein AMR41_03050 [Hapalosiphon sp. MRB220]|nr:hypothetical protein AMR41_03050 [Hapalosiphon sp. MRB220]
MAAGVVSFIGCYFDVKALPVNDYTLFLFLFLFKSRYSPCSLDYYPFIFQGRLLTDFFAGVIKC